MRQLNGVYTQAFNRRHRRVGHLFQGRFKGILVQKESHFLEVCRYIVLNTVRAKAVKHPREWAWSTYRATGGLASIPRCLTVDELLKHFGQGAARRSRNTDITWRKEYPARRSGQTDALRGHVTSKQNLREIPKGQRLIGRPRLDKLFEGRGKENGREPNSPHLRLHYSTVSRADQVIPSPVTAGTIGPDVNIDGY